MITLKRQAKVIYRARAFFLQVGLGILLAAVILGIESLSSGPATANQISIKSNSPQLLSSHLLLATTTPTPAISFPVTNHFQNSLEGQTTSEAAKLTPTAAQDYCVNVPVVIYHHIQPLSVAQLLGHALLTVDSSIFEEQIKYLSENGYQALSADALVRALQTRSQLPEKSVLITIDDGYDDNYTYAFLVAKKYQTIINFMIPTGLIDKPGYMNWDHLKEMVQNPYAKIYNHTTLHTPLGLIGKEEVTKEITTANEEMATMLGLKNEIVTYPYGSYNDDTIKTLKEIGVTAAFTTDPGREHCLSTIMRLPRIRVGNAPISEYGF